MKQTDKHFRDLMKAYRAEKAPVGFTVDVMNRIYAEANKISEYKPVLNKWFLRAVYAVLGVFVVYAMFNGKPTGTGNESSISNQLLDYLPAFDLSSTAGVSEQITGILENIPPFFVAIFLSASLLLLLDQLFLKQRKYN